MPTISFSLPVLLLISLVAGLLWITAVWGFHLYTSENRVNTDDELLPKKKAGDQPFILHRITAMLGRPLTKTTLDLLGEQRQASVRRRLEAAGRPDGLTVELYAQRKAGEVLLYGSLGLFFLMGGSVLFAAMAFAFTFMSDLDLYARSQQRQNQIQEQLPDFLDVLAVTVGAGLSFRQALERVSEAMPGVLSDEFRTALRQMDLGTSRRKAFTDLRERNKNEALGKFVTALQQAEELGAPLAQSLHEIGQDMRRDDAQYMRRKAQKLNPRVTAVSAGTLLPGLILLVGGTMVFGLGTDFSNLTP
ncbi:type II secretion system (T2SS), F family protein [Nocardiopsis gilva YIM 90087]|uniref:Type II secretion system (T2SS), F family protein n=1 Tax=Nocardiopsis gilva YIM 90087 TaxID=1235441 RepID=A0A223SA95_9ACTN|nr:type II secretion system (T2SS), F family protein [Nocardiopsis gilva YIM 90087]